MDPDVIQKKLESINDLPTLPVIAMEINRLLQAPDTSVELIAEKIENDQAIASKALKLTNSAFFGVRSQVTSIHDAIVLLGFNSIQNIVLSISVIKAFSKSMENFSFNISGFWKHSIAVAMTARYLSKQSNISNVEDSFTGGLLHDIGKIIMAQHFKEIFIEIIKDVGGKFIPFSTAEKQYVQNMGHAKIGAFLSNKWNFPKSLTIAIRNHHSVNDNFSELGTIIHIADVIVNIYSFNNSSLTSEQKKSTMPVYNNKAAKEMSEYLSTSMVWYPELSESIEEACSFFIDDTD